MLVSSAMAARSAGTEGAVSSVVETVSDALSDLFPVLSKACTSNMYSDNAFNPVAVNFVSVTVLIKLSSR